MLTAASNANMMKACSDASLGYTQAAFATMNAWTTQTLNVWNEALEPWSSSNTRMTSGSTNGSPQRSNLTNPWDPQTWLAMNPWLAAMNNPQSKTPALAPIQNPFFPFQSSSVSPMETWMSWWTHAPRYAASTWPAALSMMSAGMPQSVAWPMADANRAMIDATQEAAKALDDTFSAYRSDSGHAVAQIRFADVLPASPMMASPFAAAPMMLALAMGPITTAHATIPWLTLTLSFSAPQRRY